MPKYQTVTFTIPDTTAANTASQVDNIALDKSYKRCTGIAVLQRRSAYQPMTLGVRGNQNGQIVDPVNSDMFKADYAKPADKFMPVDFPIQNDTFRVDYTNLALMTAAQTVDVVFRLEN